MKYTVEEMQNDVIVVKVLQAEATLRYAQDFSNFLMSTLMSGKKKIIVDLTSTTFMDSTFLGVLIFVLKKTKASGGDLRIIRNKLESPIWTMFEITNMFKVFKVYDEPSEAFSSFAG